MLPFWLALLRSKRLLLFVFVCKMFDFEELAKVIVFFHSYFIILLIINRFLPLIVANHYWVLKSWLVRITIFFWFTPLPRIILILNLIEDNKGINKIEKTNAGLREFYKILSDMKETNNLFKDLIINYRKDKENH